MQITISVLIPAYNAEDFILETLDSVALQSRPPEQIIVVDDGSTDKTADLVQLWSTEKGIAVDLIRQKNGGVPVARNRGIQASACDWIALLDADDLYLPDHLAEMERAIASQPGIVAAFGDGVIFGRSGADSEPFSRMKAMAAGEATNIPGIHLLGERLYQSLLPGNYIMPCSFIFKRAAAIEIGMFDESLRYIEDRDFMLRLSRKGKFAFVDRVIARARKHDDNITHTRNTTRNTYFALRILEKALDHARELGLNEKELLLTRVESHRTAQQLVYAASLDGLKAYAEAMRQLLRRPFTSSILNPRHLLRALYYTFRMLAGKRPAATRKALRADKPR